MDIRQVLAANVRQLRHEKGLSQEALADVADINRTYISKLESGATWAGLQIIAKLAGVLGVAPADLLKLSNRRSRRS